MVKGRCIGGPRNNVLVTADHNWDGLIKNSYASRFGERLYFGGKYIWDDITLVWLWIEINIPVKVGSKPQPNRKKQQPPSM